MPKKKTETKKSKSDYEADIADERNPEKLLGTRAHPRGWRSMSRQEKLDYIASRILAEDRAGITSHRALRESGILSPDQMRRRREREVYSSTTEAGGLDDTNKPVGNRHDSGTFGRFFRKKQ